MATQQLTIPMFPLNMVLLPGETNIQAAFMYSYTPAASTAASYMTVKFYIQTPVANEFDTWAAPAYSSLHNFALLPINNNNPKKL